MTIHLYLKADGVRGQMSAHNECGGIHSLKSHSLLKRVLLRVIYGNETERRIKIFFLKNLNTYTIEGGKRDIIFL